MTRRRTIVTAAILAGALGLTACGTNRSEAGGSGGGSTCDTSKGTLVIGMVAPLSGSLSALGLGMRNSAKLAVDQANQKCTVQGLQAGLPAGGRPGHGRRSRARRARSSRPTRTSSAWSAP